MIRRVPILASALMVCLLATSCGGPSPTRVAITVSASAQLNPNLDNQPSPTVVKLYDLKASDTFNGASFDDLFYKDAAMLGGDILERRVIDMLPGQQVKIEGKAPSDTRFIGVVAGFRAPLGTQWRGLLAVEPEEENEVVVTLAPTAVTLAKAKSGGFFFGVF